ncbi:protein containing DUF1566 [Candidatus Magnetobacterium bavaricum]|uniref:Protein containing DUF1566 n=1 Tax=Candidatus Magnetobacterium bavaricum TaxID=29290 RepID=A0A0F3GX99_9BACT|nr:protein containing DUF1566 [Candidatus Magnetobacterium bavaricum]
MGYDVFISHDSADLSDANTLVSSLEGRGIRCWIDHRDLPLGSNWANEIFKTMTENPELLVVVLISANTLQSKYVEKEIAVADANNVSVIPVRLKDIKLMGALATHLSNKTWINAFEVGIDTVVEKISVEVNKRKTPASNLKPSPKPKSTSTPLTMKERFVDNGDQTITDTSTRLVWTKDANLAYPKDWQQALDYVASMNKGTVGNFGYTDWRLPTIQELYSLCRTDESTADLYALLKSYTGGYCNDKNVNVASLLTKAGFTNVQSDFYRSSTSYASNTSFAWIVFMDAGYVSAYDLSFYNYVWPVRSGH